MARHSFQPRTSIFPRSVLYFPTLRALLREIPPIIFSALPFSHCAKAFPIRVFPFFILCSTFLFSIDFLSAPHSPRPSPPSPTFFSFLPTFPSPSPINTRSRAQRAYAYACAYPHVRRFSFIAFTSSPTFHNPLYINTLGVKEKREKAFTRYTTISKSTSYHKHPISSAVNVI